MQPWVLDVKNCFNIKQQLNSKTIELEHFKADSRARFKFTYTLNCTAYIANDKKARLETGLPNKVALNSLF